jgi:hypothetical protein
MRSDPRRRLSSRLTLDGRLGHAYDEEAFWHFLAIERKRVERSSRSLLLLLITVNRRSGHERVIPPLVAVRLFSALWLCVRDADFTGWYRTGRIAGAVLPQGPGPLRPGVPCQIRQRVVAALIDGLPADAARRLHVRVIDLRPR